MKQANRREYELFFAGLSPLSDTARALERKLDRNLARRFNVLDYVTTDELGLSRIVADLLDCDNRQGQGTLFLQTFLAKLEEIEGTRRWPDPGSSQISVTVERVITGGRRIDVFVYIVAHGERHCLAIEIPIVNDIEGPDAQLSCSR